VLAVPGWPPQQAFDLMVHSLGIRALSQAAALQWELAVPADMMVSACSDGFFSWLPFVLVL